MKISSLALPVKDLEKSLFFYKDILGFTQYHRHSVHHERLTIVSLGILGWDHTTAETSLELYYYWDSPLYYKQGKNILALNIEVSEIRWQAIKDMLQAYGYRIQLSKEQNKEKMLFLSPDKVPISLCYHESLF
jgi:catechol 2,3-dioxygenase-like lactoylglutathione lyase family enzyme